MNNYSKILVKLELLVSNLIRVTKYSTHKKNEKQEILAGLILWHLYWYADDIQWHAFEWEDNPGSPKMEQVGYRIFVDSELFGSKYEISLGYYYVYKERVDIYYFQIVNVRTPSKLIYHLSFALNPKDKSMLSDVTMNQTVLANLCKELVHEVDYLELLLYARNELIDKK